MTKKKTLSYLLENIEVHCLDKYEIADKNLPTAKVERTEMFGELKYISSQYFDFILRIEYVFIKVLTPLNLSVLGSKIISDIYSAFQSNETLFEYVKINILGIAYGYDNENEEVGIREVISYMTRTYCRMRGKDFVRNLMAIEFDNLTKAHRSQMAAISKKKGKKKSKESNNEKDSSINNQLNNDEIDDSAINDEFFKVIVEDIAEDGILASTEDALLQDTVEGDD